MAESRRAPGRPRLQDQEVPTADRIVAAAMPLFMDRGYRTVTMDAVAAAAGVTKATVYYHFPDKPALFVATARHLLGQAREGSERAMAVKAPLVERLRAVARIVLSLPHPFTRFDAMLHEAVAELSPEQLELVRTAEQRVADIIEQQFLEAARVGDIVSANPVLAAHAFIALLRVGQSQSPNGERLFPNPDATASLLVDLLWRGLAPTGRDASPETATLPGSFSANPPGRGASR